MRHLCSRLAFVSILLFGQVCGVLHAAEYGADAHDHEGVLCSAILHEDSDTPILARSGNWPAVGLRQINGASAPAAGGVFCALNERPPATGPPLI